MKPTLMKLLAILSLTLSIHCLAQNAGGKHLILISVDGMRPLEYQREPSNAPGIRALAQSGCAAAGAVAVFPTVTYPNHTSIVTGQPPAAHGVLSNNIFDPFNLTQGGWYWYAEQIKTPALWQVVKASGGTTAAIGWPVTVGASIDYLIPEYRTPRHPDGVALLRAISTPGLVHDIEKTSGNDLMKFDDDWKANAAGFIFEKYKPTLMLLHLAELDHDQHVSGIDSAEAVHALRHIDDLIARLKNRVERAAGGEPVTWMIVSDHGFQKVEKQFNPRVAVRDLGYAAYGKQGQLESWRIYPRVAGGAFALVAKDPNDTEAIEGTKRYFEFLAKDPRFGINRLYSRADLGALQAFPDAFLAGDMAEGYMAGDSDGALITASGSKGMHGYHPGNPNMRASFLVSGAGVAHCDLMDGVKLVDAAPTAAALLGLKFPPGAGHVQSRALSQSR